MNNYKKFDSLAISASAGCGKTQKMAVRILGMFLADINSPESIFNSTIAMTFSRSGAKEIYNRILELIFNALLSNDINNLNNDLKQLNFGLPDINRPTLLKLLRKLIFAVNDLKICTIDSFMSKIVTSFSTELGLPHHAELISASEAKILQQNAMKKLLLNSESEIISNENDFDDCTQDSKKSTYGQNVRNYFDRINLSVLNYQRLLDDNPDAETYRYQEDSSDICDHDKILAAWNILKDNQTQYRMKVTQDKASLYSILQKISAADTDTYFNSKELSRMRDFFMGWQYLKTGNTKKIPSFYRDNFTSEECQALITMLHYAAYILLVQNCIRSEGVFSLSQNYRSIYNKVFYSQGKLTFDDLPRLLSDNTNDWTYDIAYRLNNRFSYYLIDEFQDTSRLQWQVLGAIFDMPSPEDDKSLFIVGDIKQAIYGWRSGDRRLMGEVINIMEENINLKQQPLDLSFRYGQNICTALNHIFDGESMINGNFFPGTGKAWSKVFKKHDPDKKLGCRSIFECCLPDNQTTDKTAAYAHLIIRKLKELNIIENRSSCAILVRTGQNGIDLLKELQKDTEYGDFFMWEGNKKISNDKIITALLHLLIYIQHPADTMSRAITEMLPAAAELIPRTAQKQMQENSRLNQDGFCKYLKDCIAKMKKNAALWKPSFKDIESIELFLRSAEEFDRSSVNKDARLFQQYINEVNHSAEAIGYKIRIMTIHHSKGLTFEHVFTVLFKDENIVSYEKNIPIAGSYPNGQKWILNSVNSELLLFPDIKKAWDAATVESYFETFCTMYVALSRAKYTMTLMLPPLSNDKTKLFNKKEDLSDMESYSFADYITMKLFYGDFPVNDVVFDDNGKIYKFKTMLIDNADHDLPVCKTKSIKVSNICELPFTAKETASLRRRRLRPSDGTDYGSENKKQLYFSLPAPRKGKDFGIELHEFLCSVKDFSNLSFPENCTPEVRSEVENLLKNAQIKTLLQSYDECFNELSFDVICMDAYISGCFDRVQITRDAQGEIQKAVIIDYKSGQYDGSDTEKRTRYHNQLNLYRKALSQLFRLDINNIDCMIIGTKNSILEKVEP